MFKPQMYVDALRLFDEQLIDADIPQAVRAQFEPQTGEGSLGLFTTRRWENSWKVTNPDKALILGAVHRKLSDVLKQNEKATPETVATLLNTAMQEDPLYISGEFPRAVTEMNIFVMERMSLFLKAVAKEEGATALMDYVYELRASLGQRPEFR